MKTWIWLAVPLAFSVSLGTQAQSDYAERISLTGKIWGYLKYHHTGACNTDWDQALLDSLSSQSESDTSDDFNLHIAALIEAAGTNDPPDTPLPVVEDIHRIPSAKRWMLHSRLSDQNRLAIQTVEEAFRPFQNCFVSPADISHPRFEGDDQFYDLAEPGSHERLLAMFRFWNILNYYSPGLWLIDEDWGRLLDVYVGRMLEVTDNQDYHLLMSEFTAESDDSHGFMLSSVVHDLLLGDNWMPFNLELIEGRNIVNRAKEGIAIRVGDEILSIDGQEVDARRRELGRYFPASNPVAEAFVISQFLLRGPRTSAVVEFLQEGVVKSTTVAMNSPNVNFLAAIEGPTWSRHDLGSCQLGYINLGLLQPDQIHDAMTALDDTDAIVFDVRHYTRGTVWELINYLYPGPIDIARFHVPRIDYPGTTEGALGRIGLGRPAPYDGRLLILFDEGTVSEAEYTVMGLEQHPGAVKIGSQTRAANGNRWRILLPGRISVSMTGMGVYYPDGTPMQRIGLVPDLYVTPTIQGVRDGVDEVLEQAMNCDHVLDPEWPPDPLPASAVYYDPSHDGHGFDLSHVGGRSVVVNYTYRPDRTPIWYLATGSTAEGVFRLDEGSYSSYTYDYDLGLALPHPVEQARFTLDFKSGRQQIECAIANPSSREFPASLDWQQQEQVTRWCPQLYRFGAAEPLREINGLWYAGEEDRGWGLTVRMQGRTLFIVLYFHDQAGQPVWAIASGEVSGDWPADGAVSLELLQTRGYCFSCEREPIEHRAIGRIELSLTEADRDFSEDNWVSIEALVGDDEQPWTRNHAPLVILSDPL
jgi:hypothetical protein